ncbi:hypothetical protein [Myceligenerans halotolerans]
MQVMADAFTRAEHKVGGGHAASTVGHYLQQSVFPLLAGGGDDGVRSSLLSAAGRLCDLAGFMFFDSEKHDLAQRYFGQALRLARMADDATLIAHVLGDMTMQAVHVGAVGQAIALTDSVTGHAERTGSARVMARAWALAARAHATSGDGASADAARTAAERALDRAPSDNDPSWIRFFTAAQLQTEFLYVACSLGRLGDVERLTADVLAVDTAMQRRHVLAGAAIAGLLTDEHRVSHRDPERAVDVLGGLLPTATSLSSARSVTSIRRVRRQLGTYGKVRGLDALDEGLRGLAPVD